MHATPQRLSPARVQNQEPGPSYQLHLLPPPHNLKPLVLRFLRLFRLAIWRAFQHDAFAIAKASAYSSILTFFPGLLVMGSVLAASHATEAYSREIAYALGRILPAGTATALTYLRGNTQRSVGLLVTASLITLWTASGVMISWMDGFRRCYQLPKIWGLVKERMIAFSLVIMAGIPLSFATIMVVFGSRIETRILFHIGHEFGPLILLMWAMIRWLIAVLTSIAVIALIYHNAVPRTQPWHSVLPGATLATVMWFMATALFGWYLRRYADYSIIYGSLGVGIALLVWMYMISLVILIGAEFNAMLFPRSTLGKELTAAGKGPGEA
ncbi:MAG: YihY/virulence factor BrkB family protein [Acidobacteria bacterium]|nr:YihY/virulence factor BrkB family protein [Acidobacteriota bacterium]